MKVNWLNRFWDDSVDYIANRELWLGIWQASYEIIIIFIVSAIIIRFGKTVITNVFKIRSKGPIRISERRQTTLIKLLENILRYAVYFISLVMILEATGLEVTAILAGAGVVGLAVGFGAQNLVRDIITGFFIIFEDQFSVGDYIRVGAMEGYVEEIGLRTTKIKSVTGELNIIPNGNIAEVTNFSIHNSVAIVDVSIAYEEDIPMAEKVIQELLSELPEKYEELVKTPELLGVQTLGASEVVLRITAEGIPMSQWKIARVIRKEIKIRLDEKGIEIPFPRLVMYNRNEGEAEHKPERANS
jgi:small-conductance mechanosensitive channel